MVTSFDNGFWFWDEWCSKFQIVIIVCAWLCFHWKKIFFFTPAPCANTHATHINAIHLIQALRVVARVCIVCSNEKLNHKILYLNHTDWNNRNWSWNNRESKNGKTKSKRELFAARKSVMPRMNGWRCKCTQMFISTRTAIPIWIGEWKDINTSTFKQRTPVRQREREAIYQHPTKMANFHGSRWNHTVNEK